MPVQSSPVGVLVAQLGTPTSPTPQALRPYLRQFLSDRRVIDYHPFFWQPLLRGIILQTRPRKSAKLYSRIWTEAGSPLMTYSERQIEGLQMRLGADFRVILGMTYGEPSIKHAIQTLEAEGIDRIVIFPMYPQYSSSTTASVYDAVYEAAAGRNNTFSHDHKRYIPSLHFVEPYYQHQGYIAALKNQIECSVQAWGKSPQRYIFTFHGIPQRYANTGDPYPQHCQTTAELLANALGLETDDWQITYQSRFGPEAWLQPYTDETIENLPQNGIERVVLACPGFVTESLETLDEIGNEGVHQFMAGGGDKTGYHLAPCLNDNPIWLDTMAEIILREAGGWVR